jgi:hypothetical protein
MEPCVADGSLSARSIFATRLAFRILAWVEDLPEFWKPVAFGALFIVAYAIMFGGVITIPIIAAVICFRSATPLAELGRLAAILLLAVVGGGLSGLSYTLTGRFLRRVPWIGPFVAGVATAIPYSVLLVLIGRVGDHQPMFAPFRLEDYILLGVVGGLAGGLLGLRAGCSGPRYSGPSASRRRSPGSARHVASLSLSSAVPSRSSSSGPYAIRRSAGWAAGTAGNEAICQPMSSKSVAIIIWLSGLFVGFVVFNVAIIGMARTVNAGVPREQRFDISRMNGSRMVGRSLVREYKARAPRGRLHWCLYGGIALVVIGVGALLAVPQLPG